MSRTARARLSDKFDVEQLEGMYWEDRALVQTGTELYARPSDGKVEKRPVYGFGTTDEATARFSAQNYVVFDGPSLITDATKWVELRWKGGLLGGGAKWRFSFAEGRAENAELSFGPEQDRPDLAKRGRVHR